VAGAGFLEAEHGRAQVGLAQPAQDEVAQHASLVKPIRVVAICARALAGDHDH
jgi:hypothetical protein